MKSPSSGPGIEIIYDGECPFCSNYVRLIRLRETFGWVELIDAREKPDLVNALAAEGIDLNVGMAVRHDGRVYHGDAALHFLATASGRDNLFTRVTRTIFASPRAARLIYPLLRLGRNATLRLRRRAPFAVPPRSQIRDKAQTRKVS